MKPTDLDKNKKSWTTPADLTIYIPLDCLSFRCPQQMGSILNQLNLLDLPLWRNWQTRWTQNPVGATPSRFDPGEWHSKLLPSLDSAN